MNVNRVTTILATINLIVSLVYLESDWMGIMAVFGWMCAAALGAGNWAVDHEREVWAAHFDRLVKEHRDALRQAD